MRRQDGMYKRTWSAANARLASMADINATKPARRWTWCGAGESKIVD